MSETPTTEQPSSEPAVPELSASELRLERERYALDIERLGLERERLETERMRLERERELYGSGGSSALHVGMGVFAFAVLVVLVLGLLFGYTAGVDFGREQSPPPRRIQIGRDFVEALRLGGPATSDRAGESCGEAYDAPAPWFTLYARPKSTEACGNLTMLR